MPTFPVHVCDRCLQRHEGDLPDGWVQIDVVHAVGEDDDPVLGPDWNGYVLCDRCSGEAVRRLQDWVASTPRSN